MERWKKRGLGEAVIDLTSLLDVVFIILFLVMQRTGGLARQAETQAENLQEQLRQKEAQVEILKKDAETAWNQVQSYEQLQDSSVIVSVWIFPDAGDGRRSIVLSSNVDDVKEIVLTWNTMQTGQMQLENYLTELAELRPGMPLFINFQYDGNADYTGDIALVQTVLDYVKYNREGTYLNITNLSEQSEAS